MGTCSTKPRIGVKQLWRYTTALREMGALKVTHSSFWDYSTKVELQLLLLKKHNSTVTFLQLFLTNKHRSEYNYFILKILRNI